MELAQLAAQLVTAKAVERTVLLNEHTTLVDVHLARELKDLCLAAWMSDPMRATAAATVVEMLVERVDDPEIRALAAWTAGIAALVNGQMEPALKVLDTAHAQLVALGQAHTAAATQVSKLIALAMLGRYDEALQTGRHARDVFVAHGDLQATAQIEQNLGNIYARREQYNAAIAAFTSARERYVMLDDRRRLVQIDNCMATALAAQHNFRAAAPLYKEALTNAVAEGLEVTQAEIECNLGCLALFQGRYDDALQYLEQSRRRYVTLGLPYEAAVAEQELADAYLEINLAPEAAAIYARVTPIFAELGMRAELARTLAYHGRAQVLLGNLEHALALLSEARTLYTAEENAVGVAVVRLVEAHVMLVRGDFAAAKLAASQAQAPLREAATWGKLILAEWFEGEAARALGATSEAHELLAQALRDAEAFQVPQIEQQCHTSLGLLWAAVGDTAAAEAAFQRAVRIIEALRAPLPADEFRVAFVSDKLTAYVELVRLCLADGGVERVAEALGYVERARSRSLVDRLSKPVRTEIAARDQFEAQLVARLGDLHEELNWFYSRINRPEAGESLRTAGTMVEMQEAVREREALVLEISRQLQQHRRKPAVHVDSLDLNGLQDHLGVDTALIEYFSFNDELLAFVVTDQDLQVVRDLDSVANVEALVGEVRFQMDALRHGAGRKSRYLDQLTQRTQYYLSTLYDCLLRPLEGLVGSRRLVVVPHRALHYLPFHALYTGTHYVIEQREVTYAPSARVLQHCLSLPWRPTQRALLLGVPDAQTPLVRDEVIALAPMFPHAETLLDDDATQAELMARAGSADIVHLACHAHFRSDNPLFSAIRLADRWLTVRDTDRLDLSCMLVALSACETGMNVVYPGDELVGLAQGFFSAGASSLLVSLWTVDDTSTATLMVHFYSQLRSGSSPSAALRHAQCALIQDHPHPFFWSPFVLMGRC